MLNKKIEYFITLAECLSFTQAAATHSVTQTAISQYIASLENKLQVRLFNRNAHSVSLTDAGKFFYERASFMLRYYDDTKKRMVAIQEQYSGYVKVGIGMYEYRRTEDFFSRFLIAHPEIKVDIFQYAYSTLVEKLKSGELDVILGNRLCEEAFSKESLLSPRGCRRHPPGRVSGDQLRERRPQLHRHAPGNASKGVWRSAGAGISDQQHQCPASDGPGPPRCGHRS